MKKILLMILVACGVMAVAIPAVEVGAKDPWDEVCNSTSASDAVKEAAGCKKTSYKNRGGDETLMKTTVKPIINTFIGVVGVIAVLVIVIGGISYATSNGDAVKATKARNAIIFSVVGLVIALLAFAIVNFVMAEVFEAGV